MRAQSGGESILWEEALEQFPDWYGSSEAVRIADNVLLYQHESGGWPDLESASSPADSDHDGMPDEWEKKNGLDPNDPSDRNQISEDGYTLLEKYLSSLVDSP